MISPSKISNSCTGWFKEISVNDKRIPLCEQFIFPDPPCNVFVFTESNLRTRLVRFVLEKDTRLIAMKTFVISSG